MRKNQFSQGHTFEGEEWIVIPSLSSYEASSFGRLRRIPWIGPVGRGRGERIYGGIPTYGQGTTNRKIIVVKDEAGSGHSYKVHRLICEAFHGQAPFPKAVVMHLDEDWANNRPENLAWGTQKENLNAPKFKAWQKTRTGENNPYVKGLRRKAETRTE